MLKSVDIQRYQRLSDVETVLVPADYSGKLGTKFQYLTGTNLSKRQYQQLYHIKDIPMPERVSIQQTLACTEVVTTKLPHDQDRVGVKDELTPSSSSSLIADLLYAIVSEGTTSLQHAICVDGQRLQARKPQISSYSIPPSPADGECYQPISTFAYALPAGLHASHSRASYLSTVYFGQPSTYRPSCPATRVYCH
jgi:hypothetical protein